MKKERNTLQKSLVKDTVYEMCTHPSADEVYAKVKESAPNISRATVYRILNDLADKGEVNRVKVTDGPDRYDKTISRHYHIRCSVCGGVADVLVPVLTDMEQKAEGSSGYTVTGHNIVFEGICPNCKNI